MNDLKVLMISSDRKILEEGSAVAKRIKEYGKLVSELHIILMSDSSHGLKEAKLEPNIWVYPTNSPASFLRPLGAANLAKKLILDKDFVRGKSLITADSIEAGWAGLKAKDKWRIPLEVQFHTDPFSSNFKGFENHIRRMHAKKVVDNADHIRTVNESLKKTIEEKYSKSGEDISVLPIFIDKEHLDKSKVAFDLHMNFGWNAILLVVARLEPEKNIGMAIEALDLLRKKVLSIGLVIVGSGSDENILRRKVRNLALEDHVSFVGWQKELASYYHGADIFLQTSRYEGYGLSLVEAGITGLPVVTTPVGIANDFENNKELLLCPYDDPVYMAEAVSYLLENPAKRSEISINMKRSLEPKLLSKEAYLEKLIKNWQSVSLKIPE